MYMNINLVIYVMYVLVGLNVVLIAIIYGIKLNNIRRRRISEQFHVKFRDYLTYIQANIESDEPLRAPHVRMNRIERNALQERLNDMIESLTGEQRQKLIGLCEELGFVAYHLKRLNSGSYSKKIDAAYHLGCMRVPEAVPALLGLLRNHKYNSALFVIARAITKCTRAEHDVKEMVNILLMHNKGFHDLIVDMIQEANIDQTALFAQYVNKQHSGLIQIGLIGLKEYTDPSVASAVYQLIDSRNGQIQLKAVEVYLKSSSLLPKNVVHKLLNHANAEIRLLTIHALGNLRNKAYADMMKMCLMDKDKRVVHFGAIGLLDLGEEGMAAICQAAWETRTHGYGEYIQGIIKEEMKVLSTKLHDLDKLTRYNTLMYTYEKTFGKNKRIYRVV